MLWIYIFRYFLHRYNPKKQNWRRKKKKVGKKFTPFNFSLDEKLSHTKVAYNYCLKIVCFCFLKKWKMASLNFFPKNFAKIFFFLFKFFFSFAHFILWTSVKKNWKKKLPTKNFFFQMPKKFQLFKFFKIFFSKCLFKKAYWKLGSYYKRCDFYLGNKKLHLHI